MALTLATVHTHYWVQGGSAWCRCVSATFKGWGAKSFSSVMEQEVVAPASETLRRDFLFLADAIQLIKADAVIIDGYAQLYSYKALGALLYDETGVPVIGIAQEKDRAGDLCSVALTRGGSPRPLYITTAGYDLAEAVLGISVMEGPRVPTLLGMAASRARGIVD